MNLPDWLSGTFQIKEHELMVGLALYPSPCKEWDDSVTGHALGHQLEEIMILLAPVSKIPVKKVPFYIQL